jgi:hypothetical protein
MMPDTIEANPTSEWTLGLRHCVAEAVHQGGAEADEGGFAWADPRRIDWVTVVLR